MRHRYRGETQFRSNATVLGFIFTRCPRCVYLKADGTVSIEDGRACSCAKPVEGIQMLFYSYKFQNGMLMFGLTAIGMI